MNIKLAVRLAHRFNRATTQLRLVFVVVAVAALIGFGMFVVLVSQSLTGAQVADRDLGRFDQVMGYNVGSLAPGASTADALASALANRSGAAPSAAKGSAHTDLASVSTGLVVTDFNLPAVGESLPYKEFDWSQTPFPRRYVLKQGSWPAKPGEIALVNTATDGATAIGTTLRLGSAQLTVVGRVEDRLVWTKGLLAAPGTWAGLPHALAESNPLMRAWSVAFWNPSSGLSVNDVIGAYRQVGMADSGLRHDLLSSVETRAQAVTTNEKSWLAQSPAGYRLLIWILPCLATLGAFAMAVRRLTPSLRALRAVGLDRRIAVWSCWLALARAAFWAAVCGAVVGYLLGAGVGSLLGAYTKAPPFTWPVPVAPVVGFAISGVIGAFLGLLPLRAAVRPERDATASTGGARPGSESRDDRHRRWIKDGRRLGAAACLCLCLIQIARLHDPAGAMVLGGIFAVACLFVMPDVASALIGRLPARTPKMRLATRQLASDGPRTVIAACLLAVVVGIAGGFFVLLDTMIQTASDRALPAVAPGQVLLADRDTVVAPVPQRVMRAAESVPGIENRSPIQLGFLLNDAGHGDYQLINVQGTNGLVFVVDDANQAAALTGHSLTSAELSTLRSDGILLWDTSATDRYATAALDFHDHHVASATATWTSINPTGLTSGTTGVVLASTAQHLKLPVSTGARLYTDISTSTSHAVTDAMTKAGIDTQMAQVYVAPGPPVPPLALYVTAGGLAVLVLFGSIAVTLGTAAALSQQSAHLLALGLNRRWAAGVVARQHATITGLGVACGLLISAVPALSAVVFIPNFTLSIPWGQVGLLLLSVVLASSAALLLSTRRAVAATRFEAGSVLG